MIGKQPNESSVVERESGLRKQANYSNRGIADDEQGSVGLDDLGFDGRESGCGNPGDDLRPDHGWLRASPRPHFKLDGYEFTHHGFGQ